MILFGRNNNTDIDESNLCIPSIHLSENRCPAIMQTQRDFSMPHQMWNVVY